MRMIGDNLLVRLEKPQEKPEGGMFLVYSKPQEVQRKAEVISVGPGTADVPMTIEEGDQIMVHLMSGTPVNVDGEDLTIIQRKDVIAIL